MRAGATRTSSGESIFEKTSFHRASTFMKKTSIERQINRLYENRGNKRGHASTVFLRFLLVLNISTTSLSFKKPKSTNWVETNFFTSW